MDNRFSRLNMALEGSERLKDKSVAVVGVGGVGGYAVEALARSGVGHITIVDSDNIDITNVNRQIIALTSSVGESKVAAWKKRISDIYPECDVTALEMFYLPSERDKLFCKNYDFIVDAVDTVSAKIDIIVEAKKRGIPVISSMGFGNKLNPEKVRITDISKTTVCPLARVMRKELRDRGISNVPVAFSDEEPIEPTRTEKSATGKKTPASVAWVPSVAGLMIAGYVICKLCENNDEQNVK